MLVNVEVDMELPDMDLELRLGLPPPRAAPHDDNNIDLELRLSLPQPRIADCSSAINSNNHAAVADVVTNASETGSSQIDYAATHEESMSPLDINAGGSPVPDQEALDIDAGTVPVPPWVRAELLPHHDLPVDMPLHFIVDKALSPSDLKPRQARLLVSCCASDRLRAILSADEIQACGFDLASRSTPGHQRAEATTYTGVPVSVYERGMAEPADLRLNKFHATNGTVIIGTGYASFMARCGFNPGDHVELWAFRRPPTGHLCFVIAKKG